MAACTTCGTEFEPKRRDHRFCSAACRLQAFVVRRETQRQERDATVRILLGEALNLLTTHDKDSDASQ